MIRPAYKNKLFTFLGNSKFGIDSFTFSEGTNQGTLASIVGYKDTRLKFFLCNSPHSYDQFKFSQTYYAPDFPVTQWTPHQHEYHNIDTILVALQVWLDVHVANFITDQGEPDRWNDYLRAGKLLPMEEVRFQDQDLFTPEQKQLVRMSLRELGLLIHQRFQTSDEQQQLIIQRLDYLSAGMDRLNRFDWNSVLINAIMAIAIALSLDTARGRELFDLVKKVLSHIPLLGQ